MAIQGHELVMSTPLDDAPVLDHDDLAGHANRGKAVRYQDGDAVLGQLAEMLIDIGLRRGIHGGSGFIQHQDIRLVAHECA